MPPRTLAVVALFLIPAASLGLWLAPDVAEDPSRAAMENGLLARPPGSTPVASTAPVPIRASRFGDPMPSESEDAAAPQSLDQAPAGSSDATAEEVARAPESAGLVTLRGIVVTAAGAPIPGARILYLSDGNFDIDFSYTLTSGTATAVADAAGRFEIPSLPVGIRGFAAEADDFAPGGGIFSVTRDAEPVVIVLTAAVIVEGQVRDRDGRPVAGAQLWTGDVRVQSGGDGSYRFSGLSPGPLHVTALADSAGGTGDDEAEADLVARPGERLTWDAVLRPPGPVRVLVTDLCGRPIEGLIVFGGIERGSSSDLVRARHLVRTGADGRAHLENCRAIRQPVVVADSGRPGLELARSEPVIAGDDAEVVIRLEHRAQASAWIRGRLSDPAAATSQFTIHDVGGTGGAREPEREPIEWTSDGAFICGPLPAGRYRLRHASREMREVGVVLADGQAFDVGDLAVGPAGGVLLEVPGAQGSTNPPERWTAYRWCDGEVQQSGFLSTGTTWIPLPEGVYFVQVEFPGYAPAMARVEVPRGAEVPLVLEPRRGVEGLLRIPLPPGDRTRVTIDVVDSGGNPICRATPDVSGREIRHLLRLDQGDYTVSVEVVPADGAGITPGRPPRYPIRWAGSGGVGPVLTLDPGARGAGR